MASRKRVYDAEFREGAVRIVKNKRIRELEMERDVFKHCMALWVK